MRLSCVELGHHTRDRYHIFDSVKTLKNYWGLICQVADADACVLRLYAYFYIFK